LGLAGNEIVCFRSRKALISLFYQGPRFRGQGSDAEPGGGVASEDLADADVAGEHLGRLVAGLAHDVALADSVHGGLGDASGAQAMAAKRLRFQTGAAGGHFENPANSVLVKPAAGEIAMAVDPAKDGAGADARGGQPAAQRVDRAGWRPERLCIERR